MAADVVEVLGVAVAVVFGGALSDARVIAPHQKICNDPLLHILQLLLNLIQVQSQVLRSRPCTQNQKRQQKTMTENEN